MLVTTKIVFDAEGTVLEHQYYEYDGPIEKCCGPSSASKNLNNQIQNFSATMQQQAGQIFGDASQVFNNLMSSFQKTVQGGPSQQGWSQAETNAVNSQIIDQAAVNARNIKSGVNSAVAAAGGGNAVSPSGLENTVNLQAAEATEAAKSSQLESATEANYAQGTQNYNTAVAGEMNLPNVFGTSNAANQTAEKSLSDAQTSQQSIDKSKNWWQPLVMGGIGAGASLLTGGLSSVGAGGSFLGGISKQVGSGGGNY